MILYDWFYPGFRAGGPIQSLTNLSLALQNEFEVFVLTSAFDLDSSLPYSNVKINCWNEVYLQKNMLPLKVFYTGGELLNSEIFKGLIREISPDTIYLNGVFSYRFFLLPLLILKWTSNYKIVICPRGMLKKGALAGKSFKKSIYLTSLRFLGLVKKAHWHATNAEEASDIQFHFPSNKGILIALNIPKVPITKISPITKRAGELKLVCLSLISEHKNILLLLQLLNASSEKVQLDIYGPIIDKEYWKKCEALIIQMPSMVQYKGLVKPVVVQQLLSKYHSLILLTKGENFGHSIYESFSVGRPVITSYFTPWNDLTKDRSGINVDINNKEDCLNRIAEFYSMEQEEYNKYCVGAHERAIKYFKNIDSGITYKALFS